MYPCAATRRAPQPSTVPLTITEIEFCAWLSQAEPGDVLEYHRGFLAVDTVPISERLPERERAELARVARRAWWAAEHNLVYLLQRRHGPESFGYLAIASTRPKNATTSLSSLLLTEAA